jgi:hypothetical protein
MKTHELRIGNLIQVPFGDDTWVRSVDTINYDSIMTENGRFCFEHEYDFAPITEEWLKKFGFEEDGQHWYFFRTKDRFTDIGYSYSLEKKILQFDELEVPMQYLHQIQNIYFSLTGQELKIK